MEKADKVFQGLTTQEVEIKTAEGQSNVVMEQITKSSWDIIKDNVFTLFNAYNFIIAIMLAAVGAYSNMFFILIIIMNICIGIYQEFHAKKLVEELSLVSKPTATVVRDGIEQQVSVEALVVDDILILSLGEQIPVDAVVLKGVIEVNESLLTGEADNIQKVEDSTLFSGSFVVSGKCYARATKVGEQSFANQIALKAKEHKQVFSEFKTSMRKVTNFTSFLIIPLGIILFVEAYYLRHAPMKDSVVSTAAALLGMLPKGLLLFITLALASGVIKLSKRRVLVQELHVLEALAHVDVLCLDKTGTITEGKMKVTDIEILDGDLDALTELMPKILGALDDSNATFMALEDRFGKIAIQTDNVVPFSSARKWSAATIDEGTFIIGAPEMISTNIKSEKIEQAMLDGSRVLLIAKTQKQMEASDNLGNQLIKPLAILTLEDPIRSDAKQTLDYFASEGVELKIISGDHPQTVSSIAKEAGLHTADAFVDLTKYETEAEVKSLVDKYQVFGRVTPEQKKWLIEGLQEQGHTTAMTGDGVNDVLALKAADCSVAMAEGSDAARQVAQLVLLDSDFSVLPDILMEGRRVVNNVTNAAAIFFVKTGYSILLTILCIVMNVPFPFLPIQITLIDLAIEAYPSFFMSFEPNHKKVTGAFLPNVLGRSIPGSITITLAIVAMQIIGKIIEIPEPELITCMYYVIAFVTILIALKVLYPFTKLKAFLAVTMTVGFYVATILFRSILHLEKVTLKGLILAIIVGATSIILVPFFTKITTQWMQKLTSKKKKNML